MFNFKLTKNLVKRFNLIDSNDFREILSLTDDHYLEKLFISRDFSSLKKFNLLLIFMKRQLSMDISNLDPKLNHDVFLSEFKKYRSELENIYADYPNKDKLIYSIEYWIFNIFCIQKAYGKSGLKSFLNGSL